MSNKYQIAEIDSFRKKINTPQLKKIYSKIINFIYPQLKENPFFGPNIKKLKGKLSKFYRFRIGDYRLFYTVDQNKIIVFILDIVDRKEAYKK